MKRFGASTSCCTVCAKCPCYFLSNEKDKKEIRKCIILVNVLSEHVFEIFSSPLNDIYYATLSLNYVEIKCQLDATDDFYCRFYCLLSIFRAILCPSSEARDYYTDGRCLWYLVLWFSGCRYGVELKVMCPVCRLLQQQPANRTHNLRLHTIPTT